ncbi:MAG: ATP-binding protein [Saprospiraceae bacterium]
MSNTFKISIVFYACLLWFASTGAAQLTTEDPMFDYANELKTELVETGDTTSHLRIALGAEIKQICESVACSKDHTEFVSVLYACETLVQDLSDSYIYLSILQRTANSWNQTGADNEAIAEVYMALVRVAARMSNHPSAYHYLDKISQLPPASLNQNLRTKLHFFKGYLAYYGENMEEAAIHTQKAATESLRGTEIRVKLLSHDASATCLNEMGFHDKAIIYATKAVELQNAYLDTAKQGTPIGNLYLNLAEAEYGIGRKDDAYKNTAIAFTLAVESNHPIVLGNSHTVRGRFYRKDGQLTKAKKDLEIALDYFKGAGDLYSSNLARKELIIIAKKENKLATAFKISDEYHHLRDSLDARKHYISARMESLDREAERSIAQLALSNEMIARQEAEKASARSERLAWSVLVSLLSCIVAFIYYRLRLRHNTQQQLEEEVERRTTKITEQAKRLQASNEELERFAYIASHDLKTPLRNITSFLSLIERRLPIEAKETVSEYLEIAKTNARQMHFLITDVLEFSRIDSNINSESEKFNLNTAVSQLIDQLSPDLKRVNGKINLAGDVDLVAPKAYILQAVQNLVENGLKYNDSETPEVNITIWKKQEFAYISVADNGIGIAPEYHEQIFTLFKRLHTTDEYEGTGLGLAVCKKVITRLGGDIQVSQGEPTGTIFEIKIPLAITTEDNKSSFSESSNALEVV